MRLIATKLAPIPMTDPVLSPPPVFAIEEVDRSSPPTSATYFSAVSRLLRAGRRTQMPARDTALIYVLIGTGLFPLEIARLRVSDYLHRSGAVRERSTVRAEVAIKGYERPLLWANDRLRAAMDEYLTFRFENGHGLHRTRSYRHLNPHSRLFLSQCGRPFLIARTKLRAERCPGLLTLISKLRTVAEVDFNAHDARRAFARRMYDLGGDQEAIRVLLGVKKRCEFFRLIGLDADSLGTLSAPASRLAPMVRSVI